MARGANAKLRRRNRKKDEAATEDRIFGTTEDLQDEDGNAHDFGVDGDELPLPPGMMSKKDGGEEEATSGKEEPVVIKKKKKKLTGKPCCDNDDDDDKPRMPSQKKQGIKTTPLILLILMTGTAILPALIYASDYLGAFMAKNHVLGQIGFRLGMGAVPKKRVLSFYEKHDPTKLDEVPNILSKYYGDYPKLIKKLERKYQDYGYFLEWEQDEAPMALAIEQLQETYDTWINSYWNVYAPQQLKTAARNIRYNLTFLQKKFRKVWKKHIYPILEPVIGAPGDAKAQKRKDAAAARKRKEQAQRAASGGGGGSGTRRRSAEFRDDDEE